jgi:hypothetical protein
LHIYPFKLVLNLLLCLVHAQRYTIIALLFTHLSESFHHNLIVMHRLMLRHVPRPVNMLLVHSLLCGLGHSKNFIE